MPPRALTIYIYPSLLTAKMRPVLAQVRPAGHIRPTSSCLGVPRRAGILHPQGSPAEITSNTGWSTYRRPRLSRERRIAFSIYSLARSWNSRNGWTIIGFYSEIITVLQRYWWTHSCSLQVRKILFIFENVSNNDLFLIFPPIPWFSNVRSHNAIKLIYKTSHRRKRRKENHFFKPSFFHPTGN